ncbi:MAG: hypothetical protein J6V99_00250, partial [Neisseriaceae bacterium]|nr:hypothetical protein [Neisseriaceae bacterium]
MTTFAEELNNLGNALLVASQRLAEHIGASDYAKYSRIGSEMHDLASSYAHGVMNLMEHGGTPVEFQQYKDVAADVSRAIDNMRDTASYNYEKAGQAIVKAEKLAENIGKIGAVASIAQLGLAAKEAAETGNYDKLGEAASEVLGSTFGAWAFPVAAAGFAALAGASAPAALIIAAAAVGAWAGAELGGAVWEHLFKPAQGWLTDQFEKYFGLNRNGNYFVHDPLVLDLDGDGVELISENNWNGVLFDFNGNGIKTATQWVKSDDGLLVLDRNKNGKIDDGSELFGEDTIKRPAVVTGGASKPQEKDDGFDALGTVDSNLDGKINAKDSEWGNLKVWQDLNSDGEVQDGELLTLDELGITELDLATGLKNGSSTYLKEDGTNAKLADVNFNIDTIHSEYIEHINLSEEYLQLPNLHGVGFLRDLREAAVISDELNQILIQYQNAQTKQEQQSLLSNLILSWAETSPEYEMYRPAADLAFNLVGGAGGGAIGVTPSTPVMVANLLPPEFSDALKLIGIIDAFTGIKTEKLYYRDKKSVDNIIKVVNESYDKISDHLYQGLLLQTRLKPYIDEIDLLIDHNSLSIDYHGMEDLFQQVYETNPEKAFIDLAELLVYGNLNDWHNGFSMLSQWAGELNRSGSLNDYLE